MSEFKFFCPSCGQHLAGDACYSGLQITCPNCQNPINVPAAPVIASPPPTPVVVRVAAVQVSTPPATSRTQMAAPVPARTCGWAIASLICSCLGVSIAGVICGHLAKSRIRRDPALGGRGLATAGLLVGYLGLALEAMAVTVFLFAVVSGVHAAKSLTSAPPVGAAPIVRQAEPPRDVPADTTPDGSGWTLQLNNAEFPSGPVQGRIHGSEFTADQVALEGGSLKFRQGDGFFPALAMEIVLFEVDPMRLSGKTYVVPKAEFGTTPHLWMKWKKPDQNVPETKGFMRGYALRLEFGESAGGKLPGKIYLCLPDAEKSFIRGAFELSVKKGNSK